jgi:hypothetical protein
MPDGETGSKVPRGLARSSGSVFLSSILVALPLRDKNKCVSGGQFHVDRKIACIAHGTI